MPMRFNSNYWAMIIGGSSGFGLATAEKLAGHGMNLCIVHRDRRGATSRIEPTFERLRSEGVQVVSFNVDALSAKGRTRVLDGISETLAGKGKIRVLLHSVAFGNLKLLVPHQPLDNNKSTREKIAQDLNVSAAQFGQIVNDVFEQGADSLYSIVDGPEYNHHHFLKEDDFSRTIHAMGSNIVEWVQDIFYRKLFSEDARVLSLTSEGNSLAWRGYAAVAAAKAVLESVSRAMAVEFAPYGIRSNVIQAGVTDTAALQAIPGHRHIRAHAGLRNPFGRLTKPEDVADVIFLLCMDEASWINGALICVDGGERIS